VFLDARAVADGAELQCDLCVVGAGAAGITLARELAADDLRVIVLESGGFQSDGPTQLLYDGELVGHAYAPLAQTRVRTFGGSTGHWEGWCRPLEAADFEQREWVPQSGWPIGLRELDRYYERAQDVCELGPYDYRPERWARATSSSPLLAANASLAPVVYQFSPPTRFGLAYRAALRDARNVRVLLHANALRLERAPGTARVERIRVATLAGRRFDVRATNVVVATGGIENARLLLLSDLGNEHDLVGRYFGEHAHGSAALLSLPADERLTRFYRLHEAAGARVRGAFATRPEFERRAEILRFSATLDRVEDDLFVPRGVPHEEEVQELGAQITAGPLGIEGGAARRLYALFMRTEQAPNPSSRVLLGVDRDALGSRKVMLDWQLGELDRRTVQVALETIGRAIGAAGLGRLYSRPVAEPVFWPTVFGGHHHLGTTRMHRDPRSGVVDQDCRVHGLANLYVAGSSVFPTGGFANPTLTIVAMTLRLADHLRRRQG
jgi:choline dehydrogenase-like flavoprotein